MSDLIASVLFVFAIYSAWACAIHQPRTTPATVETPINYFPEVEEIEEKTPPEPTPIVIFENRPVAAFALSSLIKEEAIKADIVRPNYATMSIRQLKAECQKLTGTDRAIAGYSRLSRQQLITALSVS